MPFYVKEYILSKKRSGCPLTRFCNAYIEYKHFFNWLLSEGVLEAVNAASIDYKELEIMKKEMIEFYLDYLRGKYS